jgi:hypothetical protein
MVANVVKRSDSMTPSIKHLAWIAALAGGVSHAAITGVSTQPAAANASATSATSASVAWNVQTSTGGSVSSAQGTFRTATGVVLGTVSLPLNRTVAGAGTASFSETVLIPADVTYRAGKLGQTSFRYERDFKDSDTTNTGVFPVHIATAPASGFGLSQLTLAFENDKPLALVERDRKLIAHAKISATGGGMVKAAWEIAGPNPDGSNPTYMIVATVHQTVSGSEPVTVQSPVLPTNVIGTYLVRLRVSEPASGIDTPVIHYYVGEKKN